MYNAQHCGPLMHSSMLKSFCFIVLILVDSDSHGFIYMQFTDAPVAADRSVPTLPGSNL